MRGLSFLLLLVASSGIAGNLVDSMTDKHAGTPPENTAARVVVNDDTLLRSDPFVRLDGVSYPLKAIAIEWRTGGDFKAEFAIGSAPFVSILTKHGGYFAGVFYSPVGSAHELIPVADGHTLRNASDATFRCEAGAAALARLAVTSPDPSNGPRRRAAGSKQVVVDLVEFWTPRAEITAGGRGPIEAIIRNAVDILNSDASQSGVNLTFRLLYLGRVDFEESDRSPDDLRNFSGMQDVAAIRGNVGADLAGLATDSAAGAGYNPQWRSAFNRESGFHTHSIHGGPATHHYSHEVFHNFGGQHNEEAFYEGLSRPGVDEYPFARDKCTEKWITILAYPTCIAVGQPVTVIPHITNPDFHYEGVSLGERDRMDNARMIRLSMPWVADYYPSVVP